MRWIRNAVWMPFRYSQSLFNYLNVPYIQEEASQLTNSIGQKAKADKRKSGYFQSDFQAHELACLGSSISAHNLNHYVLWPN